ncbi:acyl-CoA dehydrogenase [Parahaliea maris]|uniref:Acyl-CoA dehydrogenase n=1 Tax=Parahaliea maris TaxID=2716870 RepID=A0A5C9A6S6_9GAMM|nr:acyl-CoA dehydrogenase family protein [Parahaliea maris]TXS95287.1 acyl-CoA dehydrogenase [Parahaliea maris]
MDLALSAADIAFRDEVREFLKQSLTPSLKRSGDLMTSVFSNFESAMAWQAILAEKGWAAPDWPVEYGGTDWTVNQKIIYLKESKRAGAPSLLPMGIQMLGPILIRYGTEAQKHELLPRILSGEDVWCQGYSEPGAGSDLASLKMRAVADGDDYILNGSKIWTSFAHRSNKIFCLVKTDVDSKPQAGISFILVDLDSAGVTVAPIVSIDGEVEQCQVFFEDVRVSKDNLVGKENQGWEVAKCLLEFERGGYCYYAAIEKQLAQVRRLAAEEKTAEGWFYELDPVFSTRLAELEIEKLALEFTENRVNCLAEGKPGALTSLVKVAGTELSQKVDALALELRGTHLPLLQNEALSYGFEGGFIGSEHGLNIMNAYLNNRASTIYGGSAEIQRNIMAKQVLGL